MRPPKSPFVPGGAGQGGRGLSVFTLAAGAVLLGLLVLLVAREFAATERGAFSSLYDYRYQQMKAALKEKDVALSESLELLEQTQAAQRLQEQTLDELRVKLLKYTTEITEAQDALRKRDVAVQLKDEADRMAAAASQSSQLCRQEAAAALQTKDMQMQQINFALDTARREMVGLQNSVVKAENMYRSKETELSQSITEYRLAVNKAKSGINEHGASVAYLAEKQRQTQARHQDELSAAKSDRSCQPEVEKLQAELQGLYKWKREAVHQGCRVGKMSGRKMSH